MKAKIRGGKKPGGVGERRAEPDISVENSNLGGETWWEEEGAAQTDSRFLFSCQENRKSEASPESCAGAGKRQDEEPARWPGGDGDRLPSPATSTAKCAPQPVQGVPKEEDQAPLSALSPSALAGRVFTVAGVERACSHDRVVRARQVYPEEEGLAGCSPRDAPHHSFYKRGEEFDRLANIPGADYKTNHPGSIPQTAPAPALGERDACLGRAAIAGSCR